MSRINQALKSAIVVQTFGMAAMLLSLVTIPLYLKWLGEERYGLYLTGVSFTSYLMFCDAGFSWASMLLIAQAHGRGDKLEISKLYRSSVFLALLSAGLASLILAALVEAMRHGLISNQSITSHPEAIGLLVAVGLSAIISLLSSPSYSIFIGLQEGYIAGVYQGIGRLAGIVSSVAIARSGSALGWILVGAVVCNGLAAILCAYHCRRRHPWIMAVRPPLEASLLLRQVKTGLKSFGVHIGTALSGTAPVLAISFAAGPQYVPRFTIPMTLLATPLGTITTFSAGLQSGYGEAVGKGDKQWIASTIQRLLRSVLLASSLLVCGWLILTPDFVATWTQGRLSTTTPMLLNVAAIAISGAILGVLRFALTGMNRHRGAAFAELACGLLCVPACVGAVSYFGYEWPGLGVVAAVATTTAWLLPIFVKTTLDGATIFPSGKFLAKLTLVFLVTYVVGLTTLEIKPHVGVWIALALSGSAMTATFALLARIMFPGDWGAVTANLLRLRLRGRR